MRIRGHTRRRLSGQHTGRHHRSSSWISCPQVVLNLWVAVTPRQNRDIISGSKVAFGLLYLPIAFSLSPLSSAVLEPNLYSGLGELSPQCQLFPDIDIRVVGLLEDFLELLQLHAGEGGAVPPLLTAGHIAVTFVGQILQFPLLLHPLHWRHSQAAAGIQGSAELSVKRLALHFADAIVHIAVLARRAPVYPAMVLIPLDGVEGLYSTLIGRVFAVKGLIVQAFHDMLQCASRSHVKVTGFTRLALQGKLLTEKIHNHVGCLCKDPVVTELCWSCFN